MGFKRKEKLTAVSSVPEATAPKVDAVPPQGEKSESPAPQRGLWENPRLAKLIGLLLGDSLACLEPEIDLCLKDGFTYRQADEVLGTAGKETLLALEYLAQEGLLVRERPQKLLASPGGCVQLMPVERCPYCDAEDVSRGQLIEHFNCGYVGLEEEFNADFRQICPKCRRELKLIGTDYRKPGLRYVCNRCREVFAAPSVKCRCVKTGEIYALEELHPVYLYAYRLNEAHRKRLEFELAPKRQLIDYLTRLGYDVKEAVKVQGKSGASHTIDLLASVDDPITRHSVAIGILAALPAEAEVSIEALFSFDSKVYDAGIDGKMVIAIPRLSAEASRFAERQGIRVYTLDELRALSHKLPPCTGNGNRRPAREALARGDLAALGARGWLRWLLEERGYHVAENYQVRGRSGAEHVLDFYAQKDDGIMNHQLCACIITGEGGVNDVVRFDSAAYDAGIRDKLIVSTLGLAKEARKFANYQRIKVLEAKDLLELTRQYLANAAADATAP